MLQDHYPPRLGWLDYDLDFAADDGAGGVGEDDQGAAGMALTKAAADTRGNWRRRRRVLQAASTGDRVPGFPGLNMARPPGSGSPYTDLSAGRSPVIFFLKYRRSL